MKNILLILENSLEFDLTRTVLTRLGFHVLTLQKGQDTPAKLKEHFPDLVITSVLGNQNEFMQEFVDLRQKRGTPKFIWVGSEGKLSKLNEVQRKLIDASIQPPIDPETLIKQVCTLMSIDPAVHIEAYRKLVASTARESKPLDSTPTSEIKKAGLNTIIIKDPVRASKYADILKGVPMQDKVFTVKDLADRTTEAGAGGNTPDLLAQKRSFLKALFKK